MDDRSCQLSASIENLRTIDAGFSHGISFFAKKNVALMARIVQGNRSAVLSILKTYEVSN